MAERPVLYRSTFSFNTVSTRTVFRALHTPGGEVYDYVFKSCLLLRDYAEHIAPVNDPLNAVHRGGVVGTYKASFYGPGRTVGSNQHATRMIVENISGHAAVVEFGKPYVRAGQRFSWANAVERTFVDGRWRTTGRAPGKIIHANQVRNWRSSRTTRTFGPTTDGGHHTLRNATNTVMAKRDVHRYQKMK